MTRQRYRDGPKTEAELRAELERRSIPVPFCGCLIWLGRLDVRGGYPLVARGSGRSEVPYRAHRLAYEFAKGPVPEGLVLDHLCRVRSCINPAHLEPVTIVENVRRGMIALGPRWGEAGRSAMSSKTRCPQGHPYSGNNLVINNQGRRTCRECARVSSLKCWRAKHGQGLKYHAVIEVAA
jgi:hypothetical protein